MLGYWNNPIETNKTIKDGWLYSGDIGHFENNFLKITDRKKDILITPGEYFKFSENDLTKIEFIDQALVYGDNKPFLVALLVLKDEKNINKVEIFNEIEKELNLTKIEKIKNFLLHINNFS